MKTLSKLAFAVLPVAIGLVTVHVAPAQAKDCDWRVTGTISSLNILPELKTKFGSKSYLENIEVQVSAKEKVLGIWGTWNGWPTTRTDANGSYTVTNTKNCDGRRFKVEVRFQDADLEIHWEKSTQLLTADVKWYTVLEETSGEHAAGTVNLGERTFSTSGALDLNDYDAHHHADLWQVYQMAIRHMQGMGEEFEFKSKVIVKYPHDSALVGDAEASYANPITKHIYIHKDASTDHFSADTLLHELGHRWIYDHMSGENCLTEGLLLNGSTHGLVNDPCIAHGEGGAEFWKEEMKQELFNETPALPLSRIALKGRGATNLGLVERLDDGWQSVFAILTTAEIHKYDFNTSGSRVALSSSVPSGCLSPTNGFRKVLKVFNEDASKGFPSKLSRKETTLSAFLSRAAGILDHFGTSRVSDTSMKTIYMDLADPAEAVQPADKLCTGQ